MFILLQNGTQMYHCICYNVTCYCDDDGGRVSWEVGVECTYRCTCIWLLGKTPYPTRLLPIKLFCPVTGFLATGASIDVITLWINKGRN